MLTSLLVKTEGAAFLRNGPVKLTAIGVDFDLAMPGSNATIVGYSTRSAKANPHGIGDEANGYFSVPLSALVELAQEILAAVPPEDVARQAAQCASGPERLIEMYVGRGWGGDSGSWDIIDVLVPAALPEQTAVALAGQRLLEILDDQDVLFFGVYCYWTDEMMASAALDEEE